MNKITRKPMKPSKTFEDKIKNAKGYILTFDELTHRIISLRKEKQDYKLRRNRK